MICCGIEIAARRAIFVALGVEGDQVVDHTGRQRPLEIADDEDPAEVQRFRREAQAILESWQPDRVGILQRRKIGTFASSGTTFKMEGLIQLYPHQPVAIVSGQELRVFAKEQQAPVTPRYAYQKNAYLLARYLLHQTDKA